MFDPEADIKLGNGYRHYKNNRVYYLIGFTAIEQGVCALYCDDSNPNALYARLIDNFFGKVTADDGRQVSRFEPLDSKDYFKSPYQRNLTYSERSEIEYKE